MKRYFTLLALLLQLQSFSQVSYSRYLNNTVRWTRTFSVPYHFETHNYYLSGDTLINGQWYYKVRDHIRTSDSYGGTLQQSSVHVYSMALREDSLKRFWAWNKNDTAEYVRYDFNVLPTDSLLGSAITQVDTIYFNGEPRQCFRNQTNNILIEGIGIPDTRTSFSSIVDIMHCFFKDTAAYSYDGNCYILSNIDESEAVSFKVYPNPASDVLFVEAGENISTFTLSDLAGRVVIAEVSGKKKFPLDVSSLPRGVYFLYLKSGTEQGVRKLMLQ